MKTAISISLLASLASVSAQAVTAIISAPGGTPSGCAVSQNGVFGIQVVKQGAAKRQVTQISDGQIQATSAVPAKPVTAISDGQIQAPTGTVSTARPVTAISDGQIQAPAGTAASVRTVTVTQNNCVASPITQISDGQVQAPMATPVTAIADGQIQAPVSTAKPVTAISDGQVQAPVSTAKPVTAISDGQIQAPSATPVTAITDGQIQAGTTLATSTRAAGMTSSTNAAGFAVFAGAPQACNSVTGILKLTLANGILKDGQGRTGYIASNSQFQFDAPVQAGAIYTAGFSVCSSGYLALGGSTTFYQCLSGNFYNLYQNNVLGAGQCSPVQLQIVQINSC